MVFKLHVLHLFFRIHVCLNVALKYYINKSCPIIYICCIWRCRKARP